MNSARFAALSKSAQPSHTCACTSVYLDTPGGRVPARERTTQTYGFGDRPEGPDPEIHGDPRTIPSLVQEAAALSPPVFAEVLLSTSIRTERHRV